MKMCSDVLIYLESKTEPGVANTGLHWGGHRTYFVDGGMNGVGTPHNIERKIDLGGRVWSGQVVGSGCVGSCRK